MQELGKIHTFDFMKENLVRSSKGRTGQNFIEKENSRDIPLRKNKSTPKL